MQNMKTKVEKEGATWQNGRTLVFLPVFASIPAEPVNVTDSFEETEKELYEKFQCYCKKNIGEMEESLKVNEAKLPPLRKNLVATDARTE